jgi:hypothetical protein
MIYQRFSLLPNYEKLTRMLIDILEDDSAGISKFEKREEVLKFLKKNKIGILSPEFRRIWLEKDRSKDIRLVR